MEERFYSEDCKAVEWVAHDRVPIPGNIQGQAGWASEQPDLEEGVCALPREVGLDDI